MTWTDEELRYIAIDTLTGESERDRQRIVGASNISNPCDFCLASEFSGISRETPANKRAWGGRVRGTMTHEYVAPRIQRRFPEGAHVEKKIPIGEIPGYAVINSTPDFAYSKEDHLVDWKGITDEKTVYLRDFLGQTNYGRDNKFVKVYTETKPDVFRKAKDIVSEAVYALHMREAEYKIFGYCGQLHLYGRGLRKRGTMIRRMSNVFISSDNSMWFDNPDAEGYDDPTRMHGVWVLSFDYDEDYAEMVWQRGLDIWNALSGGAPLQAFERHELCYSCSMDTRSIEEPDPTWVMPAATRIPVIEATLVGEAA